MRKASWNGQKFLLCPATGDALESICNIWGAKRRTYLNLYFFKIRESDGSLRKRTAKLIRKHITKFIERR